MKKRNGISLHFVLLCFPELSTTFGESSEHICANAMLMDAELSTEPGYSKVGIFSLQTFSRLVSYEKKLNYLKIKKKIPISM